MMTQIKSLLPILLGSMVLVGCGGGGGDTGAKAEVSFAKDIRPILDKNCMECHKKGGQGEQKVGLNMESYEGLMRGTNFGSIIEPGSSASSTLVRLVSGQADPSIKMPHGEGRKPLEPVDLKKIIDWIDQGAKNN